MKKINFFLLNALLLGTSMTSCMNSPEYVTDPVQVSYDFTMNSDTYNFEGYWADVYNPEVGAFGVYPTALFSHKATVTQFDGVEYKVYSGFCPSIVNDQGDYTENGTWVSNQFASIANPNGFGYLVGYWNTEETNSTPLAQRSCLIDFQTPVTPLALTITNTTFTYYTMLNGSTFSKPFTTNDYLAVDIYGVTPAGVENFNQTVYLAQNGNFVNVWKQIDLTGMGEIQCIYFTMRSSDTGEWGMNTPAYFALGGLSVIYK